MFYFPFIIWNTHNIEYQLDKYYVDKYYNYNQVYIVNTTTTTTTHTKCKTVENKQPRFADDKFLDTERKTTTTKCIHY